MTETAELAGTECLRLLGAGAVGRLVFTSAAMPAAEPVSYILDSGEIIFRVPSNSLLAVATHNTVVGFQADDIDPATHTGWSVLGIGQTYDVTDLARCAAFASRGPEWGPDTSTQTIALPLQKLSGHEIRLRSDRTRSRS